MPILYTYKELPSLHIRVFVLKPSLIHEDPLRFSFRTVSLDEARGLYEAISYTWGQPDLNWPIQYDGDDGEDQAGATVFVTRNLHSALQRLRHRLDLKPLWVDAVCIDQANAQEKALQIPIMGNIFRGSSRVIGWLGSGDDEAQAGMQQLERLSQYPKGELLSSFENQFIESVHRFFDLPWFQRLWIIQETVLNTDVHMVYGQAGISLTRVSAGLAVLKTLSGWEMLQKVPGIIALQKTIETREQYQISWTSSTMGKLDILHMLEEFQNHGCGDDRDRIFAMYSMASNIAPTTSDRQALMDKEIVRLDVDYTLDVQQTYTRFSTACLHTNLATRILVAAAERRQPTGGTSWPSWVPDWRQPRSAKDRKILVSDYARSEKLSAVIYAGSLQRDRIRLHIPSGLNTVISVTPAKHFASFEDIAKWFFSTIDKYETAFEPTIMLCNLVRMIWMSSGIRVGIEWLLSRWETNTFVYAENDCRLPAAVQSYLEDRCIFVATGMVARSGSLPIVETVGCAQEGPKAKDKLFTITSKIRGGPRYTSSNGYAIVLRPTGMVFDDADITRIVCNVSVETPNFEPSTLEESWSPFLESRKEGYDVVVE